MIEREKGWNFTGSSNDIWKCSTAPDGTLLLVIQSSYYVRAL